MSYRGLTGLKPFLHGCLLCSWLLLKGIIDDGFTKCCPHHQTIASFRNLPIMCLLTPIIYCCYRKGSSLADLSFPGIVSVLLFVVQYDKESLGCHLQCLFPSILLMCVAVSSVVVHLSTSPHIFVNSMLVSMLSVFSFDDLVPAVPAIIVLVNRFVLSYNIGLLANSRGVSDVLLSLILGTAVCEVLKNQSFVELSIVALCASAVLAKLTLNEVRHESDAAKWCQLGNTNAMIVSVVEVLVVVMLSVKTKFEDEVTTSHTHCQHRSLPISQLLPPSRLANGTIVFMDSKRKPIRKQLVKFQRNFLQCWPYPIHVFKEEVTNQYREEVQQSTTSKVTFIEIGHIFDKPPNNITMDTINYWINVRKYGRGHHFGYRMMCRFFSGVFAGYKFLQKFEYYWRLDTDSWFHQEVLVDPFRTMYLKGCQYGHMDKAHRDSPDVTHMLYETALEWAEHYELPEANIARLKRMVLDGNGNYKRPMFYNNFELGKVSWISGDMYKAYFDYLDHTDGFMKYRWGDAPVRTLAVFLMLEDGDLCNFDKDIPYHHGRYKNKGYRPSDHRTPKCPSEGMVQHRNVYQYPPQYKEPLPATTLPVSDSANCEDQIPTPKVVSSALSKERLLIGIFIAVSAAAFVLSRNIDGA
eukprot:TRINITY_DN12850_c0_g1_i2.p1 TRINITY_DN12850_c0_g1~~TRINITY_DN12850_c0_g1_i2.p1  ORF type:complete len:637 (+),score=64.50 TRINITY_DN12850_c0_g1_i2:200-2110(+)